MSTRTETISLQLADWPEITSQSETRLTQPRPQPQLSSASHGNGDASDVNYQQLHPIDGGLAAWRLLCTAFVFEALLWGFPASFGIFQNYYSRLPQFAHNPYLSVVGTVASGLGYLGAPVATAVMKRFPRYQRQMIWVGWPICIVGLVAGSFATNLGGLIVTQGVIYGIGFLIFYYPILSFVNEFWVERRGMAYGLLCSASGVSGVGMPFIITSLLKRYGYPTTLRATAVSLFIITGPLIPSLKGRLPVSNSTTVAATNWEFLKMPLFWIYSFSNLIYGLGFFFPSLLLPSYATSISLSPTTGALLLALLSTSQVLGQFSIGYFSDRRSLIPFLLITSTSISALACFTLWRFAHSLAPLVAFALLYGFFGAGYTALWGRMVTSVTEEPMAHMAMFGFFNVGKGVGNVAAGPLSAALMAAAGVGNGGGNEVERFGPVILFTGGCMACSGLVIVVWVLWERVGRGYGDVRRRRAGVE